MILVGCQMYLKTPCCFTTAIKLSSARNIPCRYYKQQTTAIYAPTKFYRDWYIWGDKNTYLYCLSFLNIVLGAVSIRKTVLPGMAIPMLKIRRPNGRLIFNMEIAIRR